MTMKKYSFLSLIMAFAMVFQGCEDFLEEKPKGFAAVSNLTSSEAGLMQLLNSVQNGPQNFWRERQIIPYGWMGDDMFKGTSTATDRNVFDDYLWTTTEGFVDMKWSGPYKSITRANILLDGIADFEEGAFKDRVVAEAKFLRGLFYFFLVRTYGGVPLLTSSDAEFFPTRATIPEVFAQIIEDLEAAEAKLPGRGELSPSEIGRATRGAAKALLGKVYLEMATTPGTASASYFSLAAAKFKDVIDTEGYGLIADYKAAFEPKNAGGVEDVFSILFRANIARLNGFIHGQMSPNPDIYGQRGNNQSAIMPYLYDMFEEDDERRATMVRGEYTVTRYNTSGAVTGTSTATTPNNYPFTFKFVDPLTGRFSHNQADAVWPIIRYADVLLMYSEAVNESGGPASEVYYGIDLVRARSNASEIERGLGQEALRQKIRDERLLELFAEAQRWFDLKRWGILVERIKEVKPWAAANVQSRHQYLPIPQGEMDTNPNLEQNTGYVTE